MHLVFNNSRFEEDSIFLIFLAINVHNYEVREEKKIKGEVREKEKKERERKTDRETERIIQVKREEKI